MKRFASLARVLAAAAAIAMGAAACTERSPLEGPPEAKLSYAQVKSLAEKTASANGVELSGYDDPVLRFESANGKKEWLVYFQMKSPTPPGGHCLVVIDDVTSTAEFHPGA